MRHISIVVVSVLMLISSPLGAQVSDSPPGLRVPPSAGPRSVTTARFLAIIPSAGHIYAGEAPRGLAFLGGMAGVLVLGTLAIVGDCTAAVVSMDPEEECGSNAFVDVVVPVAFFGLWGWSIYDAGNAARRFNQRHGLDTGVILVPATLVSRTGDDVRGLRVGVRFALP